MTPCKSNQKAHVPIIQSNVLFLWGVQKMNTKYSVDEETTMVFFVEDVGVVCVELPQLCKRPQLLRRALADL